MMVLLYNRRLGLLSLYRRNVVDSTLNSLYCYLKTPFVVTTRSFSSTEERKTCNEGKIEAEGDSFVVSYLVNSCGFSSESAKSSSRFVQFVSAEKPDSVLTMLKNHGFTNSQITRVVKSFPRGLLLNAEKTLLPKLLFFRSIGLSDADSAKLISSSPGMLRRSMNKALVPCYDFLKNTLGSDEIAMKCLKRCPWFFLINTEKVLAAKISMLRNLGVPQAQITQLIRRSPRLLCYTNGKFAEIVNRVIALGFDTKRPNFIQGIIAISQLDESNWESKLKAFMNWGWSEQDFWSAFKKFPYFMEVSESKITKMMDFFVNKIGLESSTLAKSPYLLSRSLENNVVPRCMVIAVLVSRGVLKKKVIGYRAVLMLTKSRFVNKFVIDYRDSIPELLSIFEKRITPEDLDSFYANQKSILRLLDNQDLD